MGPLMKQLEIIVYPNPILKQKCTEVTDINQELRNTVRQMMLLCQSQKGLGLSAPQVGITQTFFICHLYPSVIINPITIKRSGRVKGIEGCLSIPNTQIEVYRPKKITVNGFTIKGEEFTKEYSGLDVRVICHEIDHLFGILINDNQKSAKK